MNGKKKLHAAHVFVIIYERNPYNKIYLQRKKIRPSFDDIRGKKKLVKLIAAFDVLH
jgi:hypothetical protein